MILYSKDNVIDAVSSMKLNNRMSHGFLLTGEKGVGKKTAERIVLELKDKIGADFSGEESAADEVHLDAGSDDAVMALMALGFTRKEAETKISRIDARGLTVEEVVYAALKNA